jgi:Zn finger protein HypA/HybF involved in hydrogenase expression
MKYRSKNALIIVLLAVAVGVIFFLATAQTCGAQKEIQANEEGPLLKRLIYAGCVAGLAVVLILVTIQVRGTWKRRAEPKGRSTGRKAMSEKKMAFRCRKCGRVFRDELTKECTIECPLCGHVWRWPPPIELKLLEDRMIAFALDPENPRGDLTFATKVIARVSKGLAERILIAGNYLEGGEMLCICERCREIHVTQKKNRGLWGVCVGCRSALLIW